MGANSFSQPRSIEELLKATPISSLPPLTEILSDDDLLILHRSGDITDTEYEVMTREREIRQIDENWDKLIRRCASQLASDANESVRQARALRVAIIDHGGIGESDYESIPACYKRVSGGSMDDIASEMGYADGDALYVAIMAAQGVLNRLPVNGKTGVRFSFYRVKDFLSDAEDILIDEHGRDTGGDNWRDDLADVPF